VTLPTKKTSTRWRLGVSVLVSVGQRLVPVRSVRRKSNHAPHLFLDVAFIS